MIVIFGTQEGEGAWELGKRAENDIITFFIGSFQQFFFNKYLFFKFINKCQTEIGLPNNSQPTFSIFSLFKLIEL